MADEPWLANKTAATNSNFYSYENVAMLFWSRCGFDLLTSTECVFGNSEKAIGSERPWSDLAFLFYDDKLQPYYVEAFQTMIHNDPTKVLDLWQAQLIKAESLSEVVLLLLNVQRYVTSGRIKKQMMLTGLNAIRVTQALSGRTIWRSGQYFVTRSTGQHIVLNLNFPCTWDKKPVKEEVHDSSGDIQTVCSFRQFFRWPKRICGYSDYATKDGQHVSLCVSWDSILCNGALDRGRFGNPRQQHNRINRKRLWNRKSDSQHQFGLFGMEL